MPDFAPRHRFGVLPRAVRPGSRSLRTLMLVAAAAVMPVHAQDDTRVGIPVGEAKAYPALRVDYLSNSNLFVEADDAVEGTAVVVSPEIEFIADRRLFALRANYAGNFSQGSDSVLDFADHNLRLRLVGQMDKRRRLRATVGYSRDHQQAGFRLTEGQGSDQDEPVVFDTLFGRVDFRYGVADAQGNVEAGIEWAANTFVNQTLLTDGRDVTSVEPYALFSYRLSADTRALIELRYGSFIIENRINDRDELSLFGGVEFAATGRLRGEARIGVTRATYLDSLREDVVLLAAAADVSYLIRDYATLQLTANRELDDSSLQFGDVVNAQTVVDTLRLTWLHDWSSRFSHMAYVQRFAVSQKCPEVASVTLEAGLELNLAVRRWLSFGVSALGQSRDGELCDGAESLDYERRILGAHVRATL